MSNEKSEEVKDAIVLDALQHYRVPRRDALDEVWARVREDSFEAGQSLGTVQPRHAQVVRIGSPKRWRIFYSHRRSVVWGSAIAAALLFAFGIRVWVPDAWLQTSTPASPAETSKFVPSASHTSAPTAGLAAVDGSSDTYSFATLVRRDPVTETSLADYLTRSSGLITTLIERTSDETSRAGLVANAATLVTETHLLLDAPAADNAALRTLLRDLELFFMRVQLGETWSQYAQRANVQHRLLARISQTRAATETLQ